jgi:hypothetical protein
VVIFLDEPPMRGALERITGKNTEDIPLGKRAIHVHYGDGMANSRQKIPDAKPRPVPLATSTVSGFAAMAAEVGRPSFGIMRWKTRRNVPA